MRTGGAVAIRVGRWLVASAAVFAAMGVLTYAEGGHFRRSLLCGPGLTVNVYAAAVLSVLVTSVAGFAGWAVGLSSLRGRWVRLAAAVAVGLPMAVAALVLVDVLFDVTCLGRSPSPG